MIRNKLLNLIIIAFLLTNCGFKINNNSINFKLTEIVTEGDKRVNFDIKNSLANNFNNDSTVLKKIVIETSKNKSIAEKNIKNEITKYKIAISVKITLTNLTNDNSQNFSIIKEGIYNVDDTYSVSLNNEKKLIKLLTISLTEEIFEKLADASNDL
mgnify:CR=1 FL=1